MNRCFVDRTALDCSAGGTKRNLSTGRDMNSVSTHPLMQRMPGIPPSDAADAWYTWQFHGPCREMGFPPG